MIDQQDDPESRITLKCVHSGGAVIRSARIQRSGLIQSLPCLPDEIPVPFSEQEVSSWIKYSDKSLLKENIGLLECVSVMKVADFLQDQDMVDAAAKIANSILLQSTRKRKLSALQPQDTKQCFVTAMQSLPEHLSQAVLKAGGHLQDWMRVLPACCLPIMVPAAVDSGTLRLHPYAYGTSVLHDMIAAAKPFGTISSLEVDFSRDVTASTSAVNEGESVAALTQLKSLSLLNMTAPAIPAALTALSKLRLDNSDTTSCFSELETDISIFRGLQELAMLNVPIPRFEVFSKQLQNLTALTSLELCWVEEHKLQAEITAMCESLSQDLATLTSLASLTLGTPHVLEGFGLDAVHPQLHNSIIQVLPNLRNLSSLSFAGGSQRQICTSELQAVWPRLTALKRLRIQTERFWEYYMRAIKSLPALEHFHVQQPPKGYIRHNKGVGVDTDDPLVGYMYSLQFVHSLPECLTSLKMDWMMPLMPDVSTLPHLQSIELNGCLHWCDGMRTPSISVLTNLKTLHMGPLVENHELDCRRLEPFQHVPERDLATFVAVLPTTLCDLRMPGQQLVEHALQYLGRLTNLTVLDVGTVRSDTGLMCFLGTVSRFRALQTLHIRCEGELVPQACRALLLYALEELPCFKELHHEPDPHGIWKSELKHEFTFSISAH